MASVAQRRTSLADLGGRHLENHKLMPDTYNKSERHSEQRFAPDESAQETANGAADSSSGQPDTKTTNGTAEDGTDQADEQEDEEEEPELLAPSRGYGKGKGKRPVIRIEPAGDDDSQSDDDETSREAGLLTSKQPVKQPVNNQKKRTFSNVSDASLLFGDEPTFPRPKVARTLSHTDGTGLLAYVPRDDSAYDNAIESSDDEKEEHQATEDDDEDYSALNQIMDDDSDVEKVEEEEESFIIHDEIQHATSLFSSEFNDARRLSLDSFGSGDLFAWQDLETDGDGTYFATSTMPDAGFVEFFAADPVGIPTSPEPIAKRKFSDSSAKRVRFEDEAHMSDHSASSSSSELDNTLFPDLFMEQEKLPRNIYQQLMDTEDESANDDFPSSASEQSFFEFGQEETRQNTIKNSGAYEDESSEAGSSGYETDMGDTTDEYDSDGEDITAPQTPRQKTILSRPASAPGSRAATPKPFQRSLPGPMRGVFLHDDDRQAIAVTNRQTKKLTFYRPRAPEPVPYSAYNSSSASTANNSPRTSAQQLSVAASDFDFSQYMNTDIMLSGLDSYFLGGDAMGPPEAFFPFVSVGQNGNFGSDEDEYDDEMEFENDVNLADFMDFGPETDDDATDVEQGHDTDVPATPATSMAAFNGSTPAQPTPMAETPLARKRSSTDTMLERLDLAGVTAFRNNQSRFRDIACLPHDPNLRASVNRPVRSGRSAETMMSPLRKRGAQPKKQGTSAFSRVNKNKGSGRTYKDPFHFD